MFEEVLLERLVECCQNVQEPAFLLADNRLSVSPRDNQAQVSTITKSESNEIHVLRKSILESIRGCCRPVLLDSLIFSEIYLSRDVRAKWKSWPGKIATN